jgi:ABC-type nitrate/sulfonate/bicarbonate transport system permease component
MVGTEPAGQRFQEKLIALLRVVPHYALLPLCCIELYTVANKVAA